MGRGITRKSLVSFNAGELSPLLDARVDLDKYNSGCRVLQNAVLLPYGAVERRRGLEYIAEAKYHDRKHRVKDFQFSTTTTYTLEIGDLYMRFFSGGGQIEDGGSPYEIVSPYSVDQIFDIQFAQINDVVYITHPEVPVYKLSRLGDTNWTLEAVVFDTPALLDENLTETTLTPSDTDGNITITSSTALFDPLHVGSYWQIGHRREANSVDYDLLANGETDSIQTQGEWTISTYGIWTGTIKIQRSKDGVTGWETIREFTGAEDRNVSAAGEEPDEVFLKAVYEDYELPETEFNVDPRVVLEVTDDFVYGVVRITGYTSDTEVDAEVVNDLHSNEATDVWSEGAWSDKNGYPKTVTIYQQRLVYAGSTFQPQTIWGSVIGDYENFFFGTSDSDGFNYTLGAQERNAINWVVAQTHLLIGTSGGEWSLGSGARDEVLSPTNVLVNRQSTYGSKDIKATLVNEVVLFTQRQGRKVRELVYSLERDGYVAPDLTLLSEHITEGGIVDTAYQQQQDSIFWCITGNGSLIGLSYERDQNVVGWHRHVTDGEFESVATIYGETDDEVWCSVKRTIGGSEKRYIERFSPVEWVDKEDAFYVDSGLSYDGPATSTLSGLDHLEGKTVQVLGNGAVLPDAVVTGGSIDLGDNKVTKAAVGLRYDTVIQPMRVEIDPLAGISQGEIKRIRELVVRFYQSLGVVYSESEDINDDTEFNTLSFRDTNNRMDESPPLFSGDKKIEFDGDYEYEANLTLKQVQPLPMTILLIVVKYQVTGK